MEVEEVEMVEEEELPSWKVMLKDFSLVVILDENIET